MSRLLVILLLTFSLAMAGEKPTSSEKAETATEQEQPKKKMGMVTIDKVAGLHGQDSILTGVPVTFFLRVVNQTGKRVLASTNGFKVYSPDGAKWDTTIGTNTEVMTSEIYDGGHYINYFGVEEGASGSGADTVGFGGFLINAKGIYENFDTVAYSIQIGPIDKAYNGHKICVDSAFYPPGGGWLWSLRNESYQPVWRGPYCYTVVNGETVAGAATKSGK